MLKTKPPIKKLSLGIALALFAGTASASIIDATTQYPPEFAEPLESGQWAAGYFTVNNANCSNGCDITEVNLLLEGSGYESDVEVDLTAKGVKLEVFSNQNITQAQGDIVIGPYPGVSLFTMNTPSSVFFNGSFGTTIGFTAPAQDQNIPALLQPNTAYWLKLTIDAPNSNIGWFFDGTDKAGEYWAVSRWGSGAGSPFIFEVNGVNSATPRLAAPAPSGVPLPGAAWMMGTALIGLLVAGRRKA